MQRRGAAHGRVDRVIDLQNCAQDLGNDLPDVGIGKIEADITLSLLSRGILRCRAPTVATKGDLGRR